MLKKSFLLDWQSYYLEDTRDNPVLSCLVPYQVEHKFPDCTKSIGHRHAQRCPNRTHLKNEIQVIQLLQRRGNPCFRSTKVVCNELRKLLIYVKKYYGTIWRTWPRFKVVSDPRPDLIHPRKGGGGGGLLRPFSTLNACNRFKSVKARNSKVSGLS